MVSLDRRRFMQLVGAGVAALGRTAAPLAPPAVSLLSPASIPDSFFWHARRLVFSVVTPGVPLGSAHAPSVNPHAFMEFVKGVGQLLHLDPADRQRMAQDRETLFHCAQRGARVSDPALLTDNKRLMALLGKEWAALKAARKDLVPFQQEKIPDLATWPARAGSSTTPPAWWHGLGEQERLQVWAEANFASGLGYPLDFFFDTEKTIAILKDNLPFTETGRLKKPWQHYLETAGQGAPRLFLRHREMIYRVEGLAPDLAREKAHQDLGQVQSDALFSITREKASWLSRTSLYRVALTAPETPEEDFRKLFIARDIFLEALSGPAKMGEARLIWKDEALWINVKGMEARTVMDEAVMHAFSYGTAWLNRRTMLEPEPAPPAVAAPISLYKVPQPLRPEEPQRLLDLWSRAGFHL